MRNFHPPDFWETEFGVSFEEPYSLTEEQLATRRLTLQQVQQYYADYYHPSNMRLFVAGKFDRKRIMLEMKKWAALPATPAKKLDSLPKPKPRLAPYVRHVVRDLNPYVYLGTKVQDLSVRDQAVLESYVQHLAHRLMKEFRNLKGQTYSAYGDTRTYNGFGYALVEFQTQKEHFEENVALGREHILKEAVAGDLSENDVGDALHLYRAKYGLNGKSAQDMMRLATRMEDIIGEHGTFTSPYAELEHMVPSEYNEILKKYFKPDQGYEYFYEPPLLFTYDAYVLYFFVATFSFFGLRRLILKKFAHDGIRWVRKINLPPLRLFETLAVLLAMMATYRFYHLLSQAQAHLNILNGHVLISYYGIGALYIVATLGLIQVALSLLPRKLMIEGNDLLIKSVSYHSKRIPLSEIKKVEARRGWSMVFSPSDWLRVKHRYHFYSILLWRKGLLIELNGQRAYFFNMRSADQAQLELNRALSLSRVLGKEQNVPEDGVLRIAA